MSQYRKKDYIPDTQKIFVLFSALFVIAVAVILAVNSRFENNAPPVSAVSRASSGSDTGTTSVDTSRTAEESDSSDAASGGEASRTSEESGVSEAAEVSDVSDDEPVSEEASEVSVVTDLPYDPTKLLELRKEDLLPTELDSYFENSVFIGNSLVVHFQNFYYLMRATDKGFLGGAKFFCASAFSARLDLGDKDQYAKYYPRYDGELLHTWEAVAKMKPETVYYNLMGLNELGLHQYSKTPELTFESNRKVLENIMAACPGVRIVVLSNTYMIESFNGETKGLNNYNISKLNNLMLEWCNANGHDFIDISTPFLDGNVMNEEYCVDPTGCGCHIKMMYYPSWAAMLRNYAYQKLNGTWKNPDGMKILAAGKKTYD